MCSQVRIQKKACPCVWNHSAIANVIAESTCHAVGHVFDEICAVGIFVATESRGKHLQWNSVCLQPKCTTFAVAFPIALGTILSKEAFLMQGKCLGAALVHD